MPDRALPGIAGEDHGLAALLGERLRILGAHVTTAESCTGGWIAKRLTDAAGSSAWFEYGFVTYSNDAKTSQLGVPKALLDEHGAVSRPVVEAMARGAAERSGAEFAIAVSGIAGPGGGSEHKPVGTVWFGFAFRGRVDACCEVFPGDRDAIRRGAVEFALRGMLERIAAHE